MSGENKNRVEFRVGGMTCAACQATVRRNVAKLPGVSEVNVNLLTGRMDLLLGGAEAVATEEIIKAVERSGYTAELLSALAGAAGNGAATAIAEQPAAATQRAEADSVIRSRRIFILSLLLYLPNLYLGMASMLGLPLPSFLTAGGGKGVQGLLQFILVIPILYLNRDFFISGTRAALHGAPSMNTLVSLGTGSAVLYGIYALFRIIAAEGGGDTETAHFYHTHLSFDSAAMLLVLIRLGRTLEAGAKRKTTQAVRQLLDLAPDTARRVEANGREVVVPATELRPGDTVRILPGERVPVDGAVIDGNSAVDESALTGESIPVAKGVGDAVSTATINGLGALLVRTDKVGSETRIAAVARLVEQVAGSRAPIARIADRISGWFVPIVVAIALITLTVWLLSGSSVEFAFNRAVAVLLISCPCALGLATPVAIMVGAGRGAQLGVLVKSGEALEALSGVQTIVFDKTGTLTMGEPVVTDVVPNAAVYDTDAEAVFLRVAASLETGSEHPLAAAVLNYAAAAGAVPRSLGTVQALPGAGIGADLSTEIVAELGLPSGSTRLMAGNARLLCDTLGADQTNTGTVRDTAGTSSTIRNAAIEDALRRAASLAEEGKTVLFFFTESVYLGLIAVRDEPRPESGEVIGQLHDRGYKLMMLTGDRRETAVAIGKELGLEPEEIAAELLPGDKVAVVRELQAKGDKVAMVGDGINDAPVLAAAEVGLAMGAGTDIAIETADIILMRSDLHAVADAFGLARQTFMNIKQNLFWAFFYNLLAIPLAAGVFYPSLGIVLSPVMGAAAMSLSSLFVVGNALRLRRYGRSRYEGEVSKMKTVELRVEGMSCPHCSGRVEKALNALPGVEATVDLAAGTAKIKYPDSVTREQLIAAITDAGYDVV
ncbi:MAG: heavy metal translocating P-type ATPase [Clostridiaceae bacterium]|nr:heavy metal translocating P-type ATPase [Clostridiaceae bacterium]